MLYNICNIKTDESVMTMEQLRGVVERITYANEEKGYSVIKVKVKVKGYSDLIPVVGSMTSISAEAVITASGKWVHNPKYGRQFNAVSWEESVPATVYGLEKYLANSIKGIGPKYANLIVNLFKENTIEIIESQPDRLIEVHGIGGKRVNMIKKAWQEQKEIRNVMMFLQEHGVSTAFGYRIYRAYGNESITIVKDNPYKLADDIWGVGFKTADSIALKLGLEKESYNRCRSGIFYVLNYFAESGHCYASHDILVAKCVEMLEIEEQKIIMTISNLLNERELFKESEDKIYLPPFYYSEVGTAKRIKEIIGSENPNTVTDSANLLDKIQTEFGVVYDDVQIEAIKLAVSSKVFLLVGGPGTGKSTITKAIIELFKHAGRKIMLAAPTGRAAQRMSEVCGTESKTIHRLLESNPIEGFGKNADNPLDADVLILDESSMTDILLMYNLLKAIPNTMTVIFIGDTDQLPSVGAGAVLSDMIDSGVIPVVKLTRIFRQAQGSRIITNAHRINNGEMPVLNCGKNSDFFFIEQNNSNEIVSQIVELCTSRLPEYYQIKPSEIQVLTPMKRGELGSDNLNQILQSALNKNTLSLRRGTTEYRLYDKVMQIKNNYEKLCWNGDIGRIISINSEDKTLIVDFDGNAITYDIFELDELVLAYAISIHKSQGGEFSVIVMPFVFKHYIMLFRNLLYTGITRAKKAAVMIGEKRAVAYAVGNNNAGKRNIMLAERLRQ